MNVNLLSYPAGREKLCPFSFPKIPLAFSRLLHGKIVDEARFSIASRIRSSLEAGRILAGRSAPFEMVSLRDPPDRGPI